MGPNCSTQERKGKERSGSDPGLGLEGEGEDSLNRVLFFNMT